MVESDLVQGSSQCFQCQVYSKYWFKSI